MRRVRSTLLVLVALVLASAAPLMAQRRGGGSPGHSTPRSGGSPSGSHGGYSRGGGNSGGSSRGGNASPSSGGSSQSGAQGSPSSGRPTSGKIGAIKRSAAAARASGGTVIVGRGVYLGGCWDCNYWGWYHGYWGWYRGGWWYPGRYREPVEQPAEGQGYMPYPYAENDGTGATFVEEHTSRRPSYGAVSGQFFSDVGSTTIAGRFSLEGAYRQIRGEAEYGNYAEPLQSSTDHLQTLRVGVGYQPRLGNHAYLIAGIAGRGVFLDDGSKAGGPEGELGVQAFPMRPFGIGITGRLAALTWSGANDYFTFREVNTTGSFFIGRMELQVGWHYMKVGDTPAFAGPVVGTRVWF